MARKTLGLVCSALALASLSSPSQAQSLELLDPSSLTGLSNLQHTAPLLPLVLDSGRLVGLLNAETLNTTLVSVSTLPGVKSPLAYPIFIQGILQNFK